MGVKVYEPTYLVRRTCRSATSYFNIKQTLILIISISSSKHVQSCQYVSLGIFKCVLAILRGCYCPRGWKANKSPLEVTNRPKVRNLSAVFGFGQLTPILLHKPPSLHLHTNSQYSNFHHVISNEPAVKANVPSHQFCIRR